MDQHRDLSPSCSIEFFSNSNTKRSLFLYIYKIILERAKNRPAPMKMSENYYLKNIDHTQVRAQVSSTIHCFSCVQTTDAKVWESALDNT